MPDRAHRILVNSGGTAATCTLGSARLWPAKRLELSGRSSDRRRGDGHSSNPLGSMICATFAHPQGLFIVHFRWPAKQVVTRHALLQNVIGLIVPLIMALITFDSLKEREFANTLGRLCFILLCLALAIVTNSLKRAGIPLYLDKKGSGENIINTALWGLLLSAPVLAALGCRRRVSDHVAGAAGTSGNLRRNLVLPAGDLPYYSPVDADSAPPNGF